MSHSHLKASITLVLHARRAQIGKYATDNGATKAATLFSKLLDSKISEPNASILDFSDKTFTCSAALSVVHGAC